ncbi:MAG TPA: acyl-CoA dehydrogenase family protein [Jatrophihabitantaceae bacterium]|nr:acyl-CoA dehydrogenase family protein [Jatrophihabitantaceae bacterium]
MSDALDRLDLLDLDDDLSDEDRLLRDTVRKFADDRLRPNIRQWFEDGTLPARELAQEFGALGVLGMHLHGYGCQGARPSQYGLVGAEIEAVDSGLRSLVSVQGSLAMYAIYAFGSEEQKQRWLPEMAKGNLIGCFGLTEPDSGSDPGSMRTNARRDGDDWVINGNKMWITNGSISDVAVVWARTDEGVRGFLVEKGMPGFSTQDVHHKISLRASVTSELILDDVRVPASSMLPEARGLRGPLSCLTEARFGIIWGVTGSARDALAATLDYAGSRTQFGKPIAGFQLTQRKLAEMAVQLQQLQLTARRLGELKDAGKIKPHQISFGKFANVRGALEICREARSILGGSGITTEYPVLRHAVNLETVYTYEGTHEVHTLVLGSQLTGLDAFR